VTDCTHPDSWFDRTLCAEPCGSMHDRCTECGAVLGYCPFGARSEVKSPHRMAACGECPEGQCDGCSFCDYFVAYDQWLRDGAPVDKRPVRAK